VEEVFEKVIEINKQGTPILLIEQNARLALEVSDYAYILEQGKIKFEGKSKDLQNDERILQAYLGNFKREG
jgi:branched-chain amino acid transport system ATP-binding protein